MSALSRRQRWDCWAVTAHIILNSRAFQEEQFQCFFEYQPTSITVIWPLLYSIIRLMVYWIMVKSAYCSYFLPCSKWTEEHWSWSLVRRLEVDLAAAEEDAVVAVVVLVLAERPHPQPLPATQLAPPHVLHGLARTHGHLELNLAHVLEGFVRFVLWYAHHYTSKNILLDAIY